MFECDHQCCFWILVILRQARQNEAQVQQKESTNGLVSVMVLCDNAEPLDFTMKATTALQKMMVEYRTPTKKGGQCRVYTNHSLFV